MNHTATKTNEKQSKRKLPDLMTEYIGRLDALKKDGENVNQTIEKGTMTRVDAEKYELLKLHFQHLSPAAEDLVRYASQMIEHGKMDDVTRLELRLRLVDLEHALVAARKVLRLAD
jgi:hypothetical protein